MTQLGLRLNFSYRTLKTDPRTCQDWSHFSYLIWKSMTCFMPLPFLPFCTHFSLSISVCLVVSHTTAYPFSVSLWDPLTLGFALWGKTAPSWWGFHLVLEPLSGSGMLKTKNLSQAHHEVSSVNLGLVAWPLQNCDTKDFRITGPPRSKVEWHALSKLSHLVPNLQSPWLECTYCNLHSK